MHLYSTTQNSDNLDWDRPTIFYLIKIHKDTGILQNYYYKIGITSWDVETRYQNDLIFPYVIMFEKKQPDRYKAYDLEQYYLDIFNDLRLPKSIRYSLKIFENTGNSEVFTVDPFRGDYSMIPGKNLAFLV